MNDITPFIIKPNSLTEAMDFCKMIASSTFCPDKINAMQSIQNVAVINGRPCIWGDAALAIVQVCSVYEYHKEWHEGSLEDNSRVAHCLVKRKGGDDYTKSFSVADAKKANLWGKAGPWTQYPDRMLQMRARSFALRDQFADALKGLSVREEVEDYISTKTPTRTSVKVDDISDAQITIINNTIKEPSSDDIQLHLNKIATAISMDHLKDAYQAAHKAFKDHPNIKETLTYAKDMRKYELMNIVEIRDIANESVEDANLDDGA
jgi:hypothetical protein